MEIKKQIEKTGFKIKKIVRYFAVIMTNMKCIVYKTIVLRHRMDMI